MRLTGLNGPRSWWQVQIAQHTTVPRPAHMLLAAATLDSEASMNVAALREVGTLDSAISDSPGPKLDQHDSLVRWATSA